MKAYSYFRFSTPEQLKGDSLRRQTEASQEYCKKHGLTLDETLSMRDLGLSAYHGAHKNKGALGEFLKLVEAGKIEPGSVLIIENLDRLSREFVMTALSQFTSIVQAGIKLVTLSDGMEYSKEAIGQNWTQLIISIVYMARAHEESEIKSKRGKATWGNKRKKALIGELITKRCPLWLRWDEVLGKFVPIPERVAMINQIYEMRLSGFGADRIAIKLNQIPDIWKPARNNRNKTGGFQKCYVNTILRTRTLLGEFQPRCRVENSKKAIAGEPIPDYYPAVIDKELFNQVQNYNQKIKQIKGNTGGMIGAARNLFANLVKCPVCGGAMHYIGKNNPFLQCDTSRRKIELNGIYCNARPVKYDEFEQFIFADLEELDISQIMQEKDDKLEQVLQLEKQIESIKYELSEITRKMDNITNELINEDNPKLRVALKAKWVGMDIEQTELIKQSETIKTDLSELRSNGKNIRDNINNANELNRLLKNITDDNKAIETRLKLRAAIRKIISRIEVYPLARKFKEFEATDETGVMVHTRSKSIRKIRIRFNNTKSWRVLVYQNSFEVE